MGDATRWFWVGSRAAVLAGLRQRLGSAPSPDLATAGSGELVVVDARAGEAAAMLPTGHVFGGVRALKERRDLRVCVVVDADDRVGVQLARFCLADGVLTWHGTEGGLDAAELGGGAHPARPSFDGMLERLQREVAASGRGETALQRLLRCETEDSLQTRLQDPETGLYDGPYATLKLDEEWKRARRFHQPLSLLLLDLGPGLAALDEPARRAQLADAAGVFLNECRDIDVLARFTATTFLFLLPGTGPDGAAVLGRRIVAALRSHLAAAPGLRPACGIATVPSGQIPDKRTLLGVAEACLARAQAGAGDGGVCTTWQ